ncbi:ribonuclease Z [Saccharothrix longispora]|uniref:ribonuclease Z n=1 Tax=Saccharothrix longispora TaxID=33920 RepID=UPI0028FD8A9A|nr:ribonuclease Z [Saccharothrix longispora]MBY8848677.1 ribonuclease Z [Saccharothrix sp. MB29]MDU0290419.1 ribonuclease Z [Saccharothrix longispora]
MSPRELVVLGTASQVPTRARNHNGYLLRWDAEGFLFDPGEGTQRQMLRAGVSATDVTRLFVTHFHGDHCLGVPGVVQRLSLDRAPHPVHAHYPAEGAEFFARLRHATSFHDTVDVREHPVTGPGVIAAGPFGTLEARRLDHSLPAYGYRLVEDDGRTMVPELLAARGITGPAIRKLEPPLLDEVSVPRRGQRFAFVMDTRLCDGVFELADGADMLVIESTFLHADERLADEYGHLTARQAGRVAAECGVRTLVLTHFSQRYADPGAFRAEAAEVFAGDIHVAADLDRVRVPKRR